MRPRQERTEETSQDQQRDDNNTVRARAYRPEWTLQDCIWTVRDTSANSPTTTPESRPSTPYRAAAKAKRSRLLNYFIQDYVIPQGLRLPAKDMG